jgi:hypothetical protein
VGLEPPESPDFFEVVLPEATENILVLARRLQDRYTKSGKVSGIKPVLKLHHPPLLS